MTTTKPSQNDRVLALLRERGDRGLNSTELAELPTCDGGAPIRRIAARVDNLRNRGFIILSRRERNGTATYSLFYDPEAQRGVAA